jgi:membrane protease subunit HflK
MRFSEEVRAIFRDLHRIILAVGGALFLVYLASGIFVVEANEMAVVFRFGGKRAVVPPGIGYHWPWPIETVTKVNVMEVQRIEAGFWVQPESSEDVLPYCLTGDKNIIHDHYVIQYRIADPANFLLVSGRVRETLYELSQATILETVAAGQVDPLLTTGKREMELAVIEGLAEKLESLGLEIRIVGVERQSADPPNLVKDAFQDVINAREEKRTRIHEAENYRNQEIPKAKGEADRLIQEARAFKFERKSSAVGESDRFLNLCGEYKRAPVVTRSRLLIEMIENVLPRTKVMVLATDEQGHPLRIKLFQGSVPTTPSIPELSE